MLAGVAVLRFQTNPKSRRRLFRATGKPTRWFATMLVGIGFPVLLVALVLAAATPSSRIYPPSSGNGADEQGAAREGLPEVAAVGTSPVAVDLTGWELYRHCFEMGIPNVGLVPAAGMLPAAERVAATAYLMPVRVSLPVRMHYRPQAPPV